MPSLSLPSPWERGRGEAVNAYDTTLPESRLAQFIEV